MYKNKTKTKQKEKKMPINPLQMKINQWLVNNESPTAPGRY